MLAVVPERTIAQRDSALCKANAVRKRRAQLKRDLKAGRGSVVELVAHPPDWIDTMKIVALLMAAPKIGRVKADAMLRRVKVSPSKTVGGLTPRQRDDVLGELTGRVRRRAA